MNIRRGKSGCEPAINHFKNNIFPVTKYNIHILEKLPGNGYRNDAPDSQMLDYRLQCEDYWMKTL